MREILVLLGIAVLPLATAVHADTTVFDSFGPGDTYNPSLAYDIGSGANNHEIAAQFTAGASGNLATVDLGLTYFTGTNPAFRAVNVYPLRKCQRLAKQCQSNPSRLCCSGR